MSPWESRAFAEHMWRLAVSLAKKYGDLGETALQGVSRADIAQDGLLAALQWGRDEAGFIHNNIKWGILRSASKLQRQGSRIPYDNHGSDDYADWMLTELPSTELRTDIAVEFRDTIIAILDKADLNSEELAHFLNAVIWQQEIEPAEFKRIANKIKKASAGVDDPLADYYRVQNQRK